jgi:hypothetical protein
MDSKIIEYSGNGIEAHIEVKAATLGIGESRRRLIRSFLNDHPDIAVDDKIMIERFVNAVSSSTAKIGDLTDEEMKFIQWLDLPEELTEKWEDAVYSLNPHWTKPDTDEKKE